MWKWAPLPFRPRELDTGGHDIQEAHWARLNAGGSWTLGSDDLVGGRVHEGDLAVSRRDAARAAVEPASDIDFAMALIHNQLERCTADLNGSHRLMRVLIDDRQIPAVVVSDDDRVAGFVHTQAE